MLWVSLPGQAALQWWTLVMAVSDPFTGPSARAREGGVSNYKPWVLLSFASPLSRGPAYQFQEGANPWTTRPVLVS